MWQRIWFLWEQFWICRSVLAWVLQKKLALFSVSDQSSSKSTWRGAREDSCTERGTRGVGGEDRCVEADQKPQSGRPPEKLSQIHTLGPQVQSGRLASWRNPGTAQGSFCDKLLKYGMIATTNSDGFFRRKIYVPVNVRCSQPFIASAPQRKLSCMTCKQVILHLCGHEIFGQES